MSNDRKFIAVGDIHGCFETLKTLIAQVGDAADDRTWVFLGDYIDRGPDSKKVVDFLIDFSASHDCVMLRGNHEQMLLDSQDSRYMKMWLKNGGQTTLKSYGARFTKLDLPYQHLHFYRNSRLFFDTPDFLFVHAGILPDMTVAEAVADEDNHDDFMWERAHLTEADNVWEKTVVFGHTPQPKPITGRNMIGIDTGCVYKYLPGLGKLTALLLPEGEYIQIPCRDNPKPY